MVAGKDMHSSNITSNSNISSRHQQQQQQQQQQATYLPTRLGELDKKSKTMQTTRSGQEATIDF